MSHGFPSTPSRSPHREHSATRDRRAFLGSCLGTGIGLSLAATSPAAAAQPESSETQVRLPKDITLTQFLTKMEQHPAVQADSLRRFAVGWPAGQNGSEAFLGLWNRGWPLDYTRPEPETATSASDSPPIEHGLALRLRIPFAGSQIVSLLLNGAPVQESEADGYVTWVARGFRYVQINIPPARTQTENLFVVTCEYDPGETRTHWQRWRELAP